LLASLTALLILIGTAGTASARSPQKSSTEALSWHGGPVVHSSRPYLIFWTPPGESIASSSQALLERYLTDLAADSGKSSNVFGVLRQYYDRTGFADYRQTFDPARQVVTDTQPYPARDTSLCPYVAAAYPTCITDNQIQSELQRLIIADGLATAGRVNGKELSPNTPIYLMIVPGDVNVCYLFATRCFETNACAFHASFVDQTQNVLYAVIPMAVHGTGVLDGHVIGWPKVCQGDDLSAVQEPNGDIADVVLKNVGHELSEAITDPIAELSGWFNTKTQNEAADNCFLYGSFDPASGLNPNAYAPTLGGSATAGTLYDQLINGHPYYLQSEWSNGDGNCEMRPSTGRIAPRFVVRGRHRPRAVLRLSPAASTSMNALSSATWNFGDGSKQVFLTGHAALNRVNHRYRRAGRYTVTFTLVDNRGNLDTTSRRVIVHAP
jgi:hypothetical protein